MKTESIARIFTMLTIAIALATASCAAVYPEVKTSMWEPAQGKALEPPPPQNLRWLSVKEATIPALTRDGRRWGGELSSDQKPDAYALLFINGVQVIKTDVQEGTLHPQWTGGHAGNYRVQPKDSFRVEVWDARVALDKPIGVSDIGMLDDATLTSGELSVECASGVRVLIAVEPAHGKIGYGFAYEFRTHDVYVTRAYQESPATRAGIRAGDLIVSADGGPLSSKRPGQVRSIFNMQRMKPLKLVVRHADGTTLNVAISAGAIYPVHGELKDLL